MPAKTPRRRLHRLRGGDGGGIPTGEPPDLWPDIGDLEPYWESFAAFARSELQSPTITFELKNNGKWRFVARDRNVRADSGDDQDQRRKQLTYDPEENQIEFSDPTVGGGWVMEDAFGHDPTGASSAL